MQTVRETARTPISRSEISALGATTLAWYIVAHSLGLALRHCSRPSQIQHVAGDICAASHARTTRFKIGCAFRGSHCIGLDRRHIVAALSDQPSTNTSLQRHSGHSARRARRAFCVRDRSPKGRDAPRAARSQRNESHARVSARRPTLPALAWRDNMLTFDSETSLNAADVLAMAGAAGFPQLPESLRTGAPPRHSPRRLNASATSGGM